MAQNLVLTTSSAGTNVGTAIGLLSVLHGGTGRTSIGTSNQVLGVNAAGTALEYKTINAGTNITVTYLAGQITISSAGVSGAVLYAENPSSPALNTVTGQNAFAIGQGNNIAGQNAIAFGDLASSPHSGQLSHANGNFSVVGDAQGGEYIFRGQTFGSSSTEIFLDGISARLVLANNSCIVFNALVLARCTSTVGNYGGFRIEGIIKRDTGASTISIIGPLNTTVISRTNVGLTASVVADTTNGSLNVIVTGIFGATYNWVVKLSTVEEIG